MNEILTALNKPDDYILALVSFEPDDRYQVRYIRHPFRREADFGVTSVQYQVTELLSRGEELQ